MDLKLPSPCYFDDPAPRTALNLRLVSIFSLDTLKYEIQRHVLQLIEQCHNYLKYRHLSQRLTPHESYKAFIYKGYRHQHRQSSEFLPQTPSYCKLSTCDDPQY